VISEFQFPTETVFTKVSSYVKKLRNCVFKGAAYHISRFFIDNTIRLAMYKATALIKKNYAMVALPVAL
jgi:hypothetical protein